MEKISIFWFRRDLRLKDNAGLYHALRSGHPVLPIFIFDSDILQELEDPADRRVTFIHQTIECLKKQLEEFGSSLCILHGKPAQQFQQLINKYPVKAIYTNHDYEPAAENRDAAVRSLLTEEGVEFHTYKDQSIFEKGEVLKDDGKPYTVFTPYKNKWLKKLNAFYLSSYPTEKYFSNLYQTKPLPSLSLETLGFVSKDDHLPGTTIKEHILLDYHRNRDFPALDATSHLSVHLRFGTISIRQLATAARKRSDVFLSELIWRDFYFQILWNFPHVVNGAFRPEYDRINWRNDPEEFERWCNGKTGYPIVDAGMRQLNETGFMHNRLRMIVASFLTKHLLIDWRWGEAYFAKKLLDFDLSANNGGWQWAAGSGCDAAPYFRIFNPYEQTKKFDAQLQYIKKWVPEFQSMNYVKPIVDHAFARERCLKVYKQALK